MIAAGMAMDITALREYVGWLFWLVVGMAVILWLVFRMAVRNGEIDKRSAAADLRRDESAIGSGDDEQVPPPGSMIDVEG